MFRTALATLALSTAFAGDCDPNDGNCKAGACLPQVDSSGLAETCTECKSDASYRGGDSFTYGPYGNNTLAGENGGPTVCVEELTEEDCAAFDNCEDCNGNNAGAVITVSEDPLQQVVNVALLNCLWCTEGIRAGCHKNLDIGGQASELTGGNDDVMGARLSIVAPYPFDLSAGTSGENCDAACQAEAAQVIGLLLLYAGTCPGLGENSSRPYPFNVTAVDLPDATGCCPTSGEACSATTAPPSGEDEDTGEDGDSDSSSVLALGASALLVLAHLF